MLVAARDPSKKTTRHVHDLGAADDEALSGLVCDVASRRVRFMLAAREGGVWHESRGGGIDQYRGGWRTRHTAEPANDACMLEGDVDAVWIGAQGANVVRLRAIGAGFSFVLSPNWHQAWWWYAALVLASGTLLYGGYRIRAVSLERRRRELARMIEERTVDLRSEIEEHTRAEARLAESNRQLAERQRALLREIDERERTGSEGPRLRAILEATDELIDCTDFDVLFRRAVELAREKLDIERCTLYFLDPTGEFLLGTYGTDDRGRTTDEHGERLPARELPGFFDSHGDRWLIRDRQLTFREHDGLKSIGVGWVAFTFIRSASEPIGVLTNDAAISQGSPCELLQEALAIYCSLLGHMVKRMRAEADRERLIAELESKNAELERFTYSVSHDLKSPLTTIRGFLGFVEKAAVAGNLEEMRQDLRRIDRAAEKMQVLLDELLELSRVGRIARPKVEASMADVAREAVEMVAGRIASRDVEVRVAPDLPCARVDRDRMVEVVQNLVDNAVKFMGRQSAPLVEIGWREIDGRLAVFVKDNGMGIDPRHHARIFELFRKLDAGSEGTGVGLALVKRIVEVHGGKMWVESEGADRGATFYFTLPERSETLGEEGRS